MEDNLFEEYAFANIRPTDYFRKYSIGEKQIFICHKCSSPLEEIAYSDLGLNFKEIQSSFEGAYAFYTKGRVVTPRNVIVELTITCTCGVLFSSTFYFRFKANGDFPEDPNKILLAEIKDTRLEDTVDGVYSRDNCQSILTKIFTRWNLIKEKIVLVVPFVGHNWKNNESMVLLWNDFLNQSDFDKTTLITRTATITAAKKVSAKLGFDFKNIDSMGLLNPTIKEAIKKQDFHAKFYAGIDANKTEVLFGSHNILDGTYMENIFIKTYSTEDFQKRYMSPMKIILRSDLLGLAENHWLIRKDETGFSTGPVKFSRFEEMLSELK